MWWSGRCYAKGSHIHLAQSQIWICMGYTQCKYHRRFFAGLAHLLYSESCRSFLETHTRNWISRWTDNILNIFNRNGSAFHGRSMENGTPIPLRANHSWSFYGPLWTVHRSLYLKTNDKTETPDENTVDNSAESKEQKYYRCKKCFIPIAVQGSECSVGTQASSTIQINPHGYLHHVLTIKDAFNIFLYGSLTPADSWFPGYSWRLCICIQCISHVGWSYHQANTTKHEFIGLRRDAIIKD